MAEEKKVESRDVHHMAQLSRLVIRPEEEQVFARQFGEILGHMAILASVDTENVEPLYIPISQPSRPRADEARDLRKRSEILANAPETDGDSFIVPRIV